MASYQSLTSSSSFPAAMEMSSSSMGPLSRQVPDSVSENGMKLLLELYGTDNQKPEEKKRGRKKKIDAPMMNMETSSSIQITPGRKTISKAERQKQIRQFCIELQKYQKDPNPKPADLAVLEDTARELFRYDESIGNKLLGGVTTFCACCQKMSLTSAQKPNGNKLPVMLTFPGSEGGRVCTLCHSRTRQQYLKQGVFRCHRKGVTEYVVNEMKLQKDSEEARRQAVDNEEETDTEGAIAVSLLSQTDKRRLRILDFSERVLKVQKGEVPSDDAMLREMFQETKLLFPRDKEEVYKTQRSGPEIYCVCCRKQTITSEKVPNGYKSLPCSIVIPGADEGRVCSFCYTRATKQFSHHGIFICHRKSIMDFVVNEALLHKTATERAENVKKPIIADVVASSVLPKEEQKKMDIHRFAMKVLQYQRSGQTDPRSVANLNREANLIWNVNRPDFYQAKSGSGVEMFCVCCQKLTMTSERNPTGHKLPAAISFPGSDQGRICYFCHKRAQRQFTDVGIFRCHRKCATEYVVNENYAWNAPAKVMPPRKTKSQNEDGSSDDEGAVAKRSSSSKPLGAKSRDLSADSVSSMDPSVSLAPQRLPPQPRILLQSSNNMSQMPMSQMSSLSQMSQAQQAQLPPQLLVAPSQMHLSQLLASSQPPITMQSQHVPTFLHQPQYLAHGEPSAHLLISPQQQPMQQSAQVSTFERPRDSFERPRDTFEQPRHTFEQPRHTFDQPRDTFDRPRDTFERPRDTFERPRDTFERPIDTFERPVDTYVRPRESDASNSKIISQLDDVAPSSSYATEFPTNTDYDWTTLLGQDTNPTDSSGKRKATETTTGSGVSIDELHKDKMTRL